MDDENCLTKKQKTSHEAAQLSERLSPPHTYWDKNFMNISDDLIRYIALWLPLNDLPNLALSSHKMNKILFGSYFWRLKCFELPKWYHPEGESMVVYRKYLGLIYLRHQLDYKYSLETMVSTESICLVYNRRFFFIPREICQLTNLRKLNLGFNYIVNVPQELGQLRGLEILLLNNNGLLSVPKELSQLSKLLKLDLRCNPQLISFPIEFKLIKHSIV